MEKNHVNKKYLSVLLVILILLVSVFIPAITAKDNISSLGFNKGLSYTNVVPTKKTTFVAIDEDTLVDDYAYLSAVPTAVFKYEDSLISNPLLFYQDEIEEDEDKYKSLNAYTGIEYFMEDWTDYCYQLDQMTLINVDKDNVDQWKSNKYVEIKGDNPYKIAGDLALNDWSYSDKAVVSVIDDDFKSPNNEISNKIEYTLPKGKIDKNLILKTKQTNSLNPISGQFTISEGYKFMIAEAWWDGVIAFGTMVPTGDPDLQLHFKNGEDWMQAVAVANWNVYSPIGHEITQSYIYQPGDWRIYITDFPTESDAPEKKIGPITIQGSLLNMFKKTVTYNVEVTLFPGISLDIPDIPVYGSKYANFKLKWSNPNVNLGFTIIGPSGESIVTVIDESKTDEQELDIERLGECLPGENYKISVFSTTDVNEPVNFEIDYNWTQEVTKEKGYALDSAANGAVLASQLNAPLLYVKPSELPTFTKDVLYKLGINEVFIVDIGNRLSNNVLNQIKDMVKSLSRYSEYNVLFDEIRSLSGNNDVIFTTIDPWTSWLVGENKPYQELKESLFIGPAAFIAAHHGSPVLIIENHPHLSGAAVWHNEFWRRNSALRYEEKPSVAEMVFTGKKIYSFLKEYGFDTEGKESIVTVADQYDIGVPWDRIFPGVANSGRFCGSPVDCSIWISRSVFYPALIYVNPAVKDDSVELETGSSSSREGLIGLLKYPYLNSLVINEEPHKEDFSYPVLCSFVTIKHRFNERASNYYGSKYQCADGLIPGETTTLDAIDQGINKKYYGLDGMYFPDICESEVIPFYFERGGYDTVFSTRLEEVTSNLNKGVILWIHTSHGTQGNGGQTLFWDTQNGYHTLSSIKKFTGAYYETNPWRGYDWLLGSTEEPDTMSMDIKGIIPFTNHKSIFFPAMGLDWVLARKPLREKLVNMPILGNLFSKIITVDDLYDGITGSISYSKEPTDWKNAFELEEKIDNLHSAGFITGICQTSNTYLHLMMIRHGSVFQVQDPWPTSWYGAVWRQSIPRDIILGSTVGEAYTKGISHVGTLYLGGGQNDKPQWWWDDAENVVYFGDPDIRMFVPENDYSNLNYWEKPKSVVYDESLRYDGHMPFGVESYPNEKQQLTVFQEYLWLIIIIIVIIILIVVVLISPKKKK